MVPRVPLSAPAGGCGRTTVPTSNQGGRLVRRRFRGSSHVVGAARGAVLRVERVEPGGTARVLHGDHLVEVAVRTVLVVARRLDPDGAVRLGEDLGDDRHVVGRLVVVPVVEHDVADPDLAPLVEGASGQPELRGVGRHPRVHRRAVRPRGAVLGAAGPVVPVGALLPPAGDQGLRHVVRAVAADRVHGAVLGEVVVGPVPHRVRELPVDVGQRRVGDRRRRDRRRCVRDGCGRGRRGRGRLVLGRAGLPVVRRAAVAVRGPVGGRTRRDRRREERHVRRAGRVHRLVRSREGHLRRRGPHVTRRDPADRHPTHLGQAGSGDRDGDAAGERDLCGLDRRGRRAGARRRPTVLATGGRLGRPRRSGRARRARRGVVAAGAGGDGEPDAGDAGEGEQGAAGERGSHVCTRVGDGAAGSPEAHHRPEGPPPACPRATTSSSPPTPTPPASASATHSSVRATPSRTARRAPCVRPAAAWASPC
ncbi:hypothetical protein Cus16_0850 [Curtobacterium sp. ER1/6]|nr:hypothetical protein Cus16_0850 [Curtobacterium sp. ER1/6]